jgi:hypothetical protein
LVNADIPSVPDPSHKDIPVLNNITNINDFPDYVFVIFNPNPRCQSAVIGSDGIIPTGYNRCSIVDVYAVKKEDFSDSLINERAGDAYAFFNSSKAIKVLSNIEISRSILVTSTEGSVYKTYEINLSQVQTSPFNVDIERSYAFYWYLLIPIIALIIVIIVLVKRKKNKKKRK